MKLHHTYKASFLDVIQLPILKWSVRYVEFKPPDPCAHNGVYEIYLYLNIPDTSCSLDSYSNW